ncbi:MAG: hypothetical protein KDJ47_03360 [Hyphomicrobiaceae bacterium]|nr:hypothetical protein [Hyphomicrobiaceae bacterium]
MGCLKGASMERPLSAFPKYDNYSIDVVGAGMDGTATCLSCETPKGKAKL